jgi:hypothetical protein
MGMILCRENVEISTAPDWDVDYQQRRVGPQARLSFSSFPLKKSD